MLQYLADGLVLGATIGLGAVGLTLTYGILRFANFAHGELVTWGAYLALAILWAMAGLTGADLGHAAGRIGPLGFGWPLILALLIAMAATGGLAWLLDRLLFARLRRHGTSIVLVIASFGAALALKKPRHADLRADAGLLQPRHPDRACRWCRATSWAASA